VFGPEPSSNFHAESDESTRAVFAQATWPLAERWRVTAGLRQNHEEHRYNSIGTGTDDSPTLIETTNDWSNNSWRLDLAYSANDDLLAYAGISTGFKSGGVLLRPGGVFDNYDPEDLTAYELGVKMQRPAQVLTLNAAVFYYDFRDLQIETFTVTDTGLVFETDNAARVEIYGIDTDVSWQPAERLKLSGGVVWLPQAEFVEYRNDRDGDTLSGNRVTRAPEWTAVMALDYEHPLRTGRLAARLEYNYRSDFFYTTSNDANFSQQQFGLLNLLLRFESASENWYVFASGRNLANEDYFNQVFLQASPGYPDTYEAGFGYRF